MWRWNLGLLLEGISEDSINCIKLLLPLAYTNTKDKWINGIFRFNHQTSAEWKSIKISSNWVWNVTVELNRIPFVIYSNIKKIIKFTFFTLWFHHQTIFYYPQHDSIFHHIFFMLRHRFFAPAIFYVQGFLLFYKPFSKNKFGFDLYLTSTCCKDSYYFKSFTN